MLSLSLKSPRFVYFCTCLYLFCMCNSLKCVKLTKMSICDEKKQPDIYNKDPETVWLPVDDCKQVLGGSRMALRRQLICRNAAKHIIWGSKNEENQPETCVPLNKTVLLN